MEAAATINVRLPEGLKQSGSMVLERNGVSPTDLVRSVYSYMDRFQEVPTCLDVAPQNGESIYQQRRSLLRRFDGFVVDDYDSSCKADRASRIEEKYGDLL